MLKLLPPHLLRMAGLLPLQHCHLLSHGRCLLLGGGTLLPQGSLEEGKTSTLERHLLS